jgi:hypothetical protein
VVKVAQTECFGSKLASESISKLFVELFAHSLVESVFESIEEFIVELLVELFAAIFGNAYFLGLEVVEGCRVPPIWVLAVLLQPNSFRIPAHEQSLDNCAFS